MKKVTTVFLTIITLLVVNTIRASSAQIGGQINGYQCVTAENRWKTENDATATLPSGYTFESIIVKAGNENSGTDPCIEVYPNNTFPTCYQVIINGNTVTVTKIGSGSSCKDISHLEGTYGQSDPSATPTPTTEEDSPTPTNTQVPSPTNTPTPERETPTPTEEQENSPTPTPTDSEEEPSPTPTNTPTPEYEEESTPTPTQTPKPTNSPTPGPTNTPGPGPTNTPGPSPTNTPGPTNTPAPETSNPVVQGVTRTSTAQTLGADNNFNPIVLGLKRSFGGQILGTSTFPKTGAEDIEEAKLPSGNDRIENTTLSIPAIGVNQPVYQGGKLGDMLIVGDKEILKAADYPNVYYGHNTQDTLGSIEYLSYGDNIIVQEQGSVSMYMVTYKQYINGTAQMDQYVKDNKLTLVSCSLQNQDIRVIITAEEIN